MTTESLFADLHKRKVFGAASIYGAAACGLIEIIVTIGDQLFLPAWVATLSVIVFVVGLTVAMFLAWTFDVTSGGIRRTTIGSGRGAFSIAGSITPLISGTAGLFLLIRPAMPDANPDPVDQGVLPHSIAVLPL